MMLFILVKLRTKMAKQALKLSFREFLGAPFWTQQRIGEITGYLPRLSQKTGYARDSFFENNWEIHAATAEAQQGQESSCSKRLR
jgi:hypothetical protein